MELVFTEHARYRMATRGISHAMVEQTLQQPDTRGFGYGGRHVALKAFSQGTVKVVYVVEGAAHVIITVMWRSP